MQLAVQQGRLVILDLPIEVKSKKKARNDRVTVIMLFLALIVGLVLVSYPSVADFWNRTHASKAIANYLENTATIGEEMHDEVLADALKYNQDLVFHPLGGTLNAEQQARYNNALSIQGSTILGYVEIKKIGVSIPIYHGTDEEVLQVAIGHLSWSSLPVGAATWDEETGTVGPEDGSHCIISGHRGLPSAKLFTDIVELVEGDLFALNTLGDIYVYEVDQIRTVEPEDLSNLHIEKGKDFCTLVTCTPYGINSHRLLVRGHRISTTGSNANSFLVQSNATQVPPRIVALFLGMLVAVALFLVILIVPAGLFSRRSILEE